MSLWSRNEEGLLLYWNELGGDMEITYDGVRDVWRAVFSDRGIELRAAGRDIRFIGQGVRAYFRHELFLRSLVAAHA